MAKSSDKEKAPKGTTRVADIVIASKSLADGKSYEDGYPDTMEMHINRGGSNRKKVKGG